MKRRVVLGYCAALLVLAAAFSSPLPRHFACGIPYAWMPAAGRALVRRQPGDCLQLYYRLWLFTEAVRGRIPFFSNPYEFSTPETPPRFNPQAVPLSLAYAPLSPAGGIAAYNALVLLSFAAAGAALAALVRLQTGSAGAGLLCGALYACFPHRLGHLFGGHPGGFTAFVAPLMLVLAAGAWRGPRGSFGRGAAAGACVLAIALVDPHQSLYLGVLLPAFGGMTVLEVLLREGAPQALRSSRRPLCGLLLAGACAGAYILWLHYRFLGDSTMGGGRVLDVVRGASPGLRDLLRPGPDAEKNIYPGIVACALALAGIIARGREIRRGLAPRGALPWLLFWAVLAAFCTLLALGPNLDAYLPLYSRLYRLVPILRYSRTPGRIIGIAALGLFVLAGHGLRPLLGRGRAGAAAALALCALGLADYRPGGPVGVTIPGGAGPVYAAVRDGNGGGRLLELPIWPGDSAWSSLYEYGATLTRVPIVNGYSPAPQLRYRERVFAPLKSLNLGELRADQHALLARWDVRHVVLHQEAFPRQVSPFPFRFTLRNLERSPYLEFLSSDGPLHLFRVREVPAGPSPAFGLSSPAAFLWAAGGARTGIGAWGRDTAACSGGALSSHAPDARGVLMRTDPRFFPTGAFTAEVNLKSGAAAADGAVARIEVCAPGRDGPLAAREIPSGDFKGADGYRLFEVDFSNGAPGPVEVVVSRLGEAPLAADFIGIRFAVETDPCGACEAEDLFHIGRCVADPSASGGFAVETGTDEDPSMPIAEGPGRTYGPGRWRVRFRMRAGEVEDGVIARIEAANAFGGTLAKRDLSREDFAGARGYRGLDLEIGLERPAPLSFRVWQFNRARLRLDRIEAERLQE